MQEQFDASHGLSTLMVIKTTICLITFLYLLVIPAMAQERLTYRVDYSTEKTDRIHVLIVPSKPIKGVATLVIPRAIPSGYAQQFYDRYVDAVRAVSSAGTVLTTEREDGPRWRLGASNTDVASVEYEVDLSRLEREIIDASDTSKARSGWPHSVRRDGRPCCCDLGVQH